MFNKLFIDFIKCTYTVDEIKNFIKEIDNDDDVVSPKLEALIKLVFGLNNNSIGARFFVYDVCRECLNQLIEESKPSKNKIKIWVE